ncbi:MAG TPA: aryl-sulfate sulfotransferase, partial [Chitinophagales bacterium]|nr:aryl-sulfate sulfotransferase [Chitinophagales bacterium]
MKKVICGAICMLLFYHAASAQFRYVSPMPGTKYHNPERSIILREGSLLDAASLHGKDQFIVEGSKSKLHAVQRKLADDGKTILLIPEIPFALEEEIKVTVKAGIRKLSGEKLEGYTFNFYTRSAHSLESQQQFATHRKKILAEEFGVNKESTSKGPAEGGPPFTIDVNINPAPGALFYHNISLLGAAVEQSQIMTSDGHFIFRHESQVKGINFDINRNGYLTSYNEATESYDMFDSSYNTIGTYKAGNGYVTDIHDFQVFQDGHSFIAGLDYQTIDMTVYDPDYSEQATVIGAILQELDASKNVIFEWRSWDYVDIPEALHETLSFGFIDYVHANSMELDVDGNILLSCRNLDQVIKIDRNTGVMIWRLGGIKNEFVFLNDTLRFNYQHDARRIANGNITLYDNGNYHPVKASFAKEYRIDEVNKTVSKVWSYSHPFINGKTVRGFAMGNVQRLPNGNTLINWGSIYAGSVLGKGSPNLTEVDSSGNIVWEMTLNESNKGVIYRAHRYEWTPCARSAEKSLKESNITQSSAKLSWGKATNATGYTVFYKRKTDSTWNSKNANGNSKVLNDLEPGTTYQWYLQSKCDTNIITVSANSKTRKFATLPLKNAQAEKTALSMQVYPNPCGSWMKVVGFGEEKL